MIRKIIAHGNPVLKQEGEWIEEGHENLKEIVADMYDTMKGANGIGLAAQQIGLPLKLFVLNLSHHTGLEDYKKAFLNSEIIEESEEEFSFEEGCLSFPGIHFNVSRSKKIKVLYQDENFVEHTEWLEGIQAIAFQHEHDHTEGIVFLDHNPKRRMLLKKKLTQISTADIAVHYPMKFNV